MSATFDQAVSGVSVAEWIVSLQVWCLTYSDSSCMVVDPKWFDNQAALTRALSRNAARMKANLKRYDGLENLYEYR